MKNCCTWLCLFLVSIIPTFSLGGIANPIFTSEVDTSTIRRLDIHSFMGKWYEIARYENRFERGMSHVSATYSLNENGKIRVLNEGVKSGKPHRVKGKAFLPDPYNYPGRLRVSFFLWFYSDYYIFELDNENYKYAVIGSSDRDYLWILYREPVMPTLLLQELVERIQNRGYDTSKLLFVNHN